MIGQNLRLKVIPLFFLLVFININNYSQVDTTIFYLSEDFETSPRNWTSLPVDNTIKWIYQDGGHDHNPYSALHGVYNAIFYYNGFISQVRDLVSYPVDLSHAVKPKLTFYHTQAQSIDGTDNLLILFRKSATSPWDTIETYTNPISSWTKRSFNIDDEGGEFLNEDFYLAFRGIANGGHGICIDSVRITETAIIDRYVNDITASDVISPVVPSGVRALPVFRININVIGNNNSLVLDSLIINSNSTDNSVFETNGLQLFYTRNEIYRNKENSFSTKLGSSASISDGAIVFKNLNKTLRTGNNYLWLAVDIKSDASHSSIIDFQVNADNIFISGNVYPAADLSPSGFNKIEEAVFYDNFDTDKGWTLEPDFERDSPKGKFVYISSDPDYAFSGTNVLGTDLNDDGAYKLNIESANAYFATTPVLDMKYYDRINLSMMKWIAFEQQDEARIEVSTDNGASWTTLWNSQVSGQQPEYGWNNLFFSQSFNNLVRRKSAVKLRFGIHFSDNNYAYAGWNIDNFAITGEYLTNEVGVSNILLPCTDCFNPGFDTVKVVVRNYAAIPSPPNIPIFFSLNGATGPKIYDTLKTSIPVDGSIVFTFKTLANFPGPGDYNFLVSTDKSGDQDRTNDSSYTQIRIQDFISPPVLINFEVNEGYWISGGRVNTWECMVPDASIGQLPGSPTSWILSPFGLYSDNDSSFVISSCYNLNSSKNLILEMKYTNTSQAGIDGANVQYTTDDGTSWNVIQNNIYGFPWNWYSSPVLALGANGWSGNSDGWQVAKTLIPSSLLTYPRVKFRVLWMSDGDPTDGARGIAFDDFTIYPAPPDVGVSSISIPKDTCQFCYPDNLNVWIKNYGLNTIEEDDTMVIGYTFETETPVISSFIMVSDLAPGDSMLFTIPTTYDVTAPGTYQIAAYTLIEDDPWFYGTNNDTAWKVFEIWPNPLTDMPDTISSRTPNSLVIQSIIDPDYSYYWYEVRSGRSSTNSTFQVEVPGTIYYTVTDINHGCQTYDSIYIELLFNDVGVRSILSPLSDCEQGNAENIEVQIHNFGTDSLIIGDKIYVYYQLNGGPVVTDSVILEAPLYSKTSLPFTFEEKTEDFSPEGAYELFSWAYYDGDTIPENDSTIDTIYVYGYPVLDLGNDTTINWFEYNLVVPVFPVYLWSDGHTGGTRLIDSSGYYALTVTDENGCQANDDINIWLRIHDIQPYILVNPVSSCNRSGPDPVRVRILNNGSDTILASEMITASYSINGGSRVSGIVAHTQMLPGAYVDHTFPGTVNLIPVGSYQFDVTAVIDGDIRTDNDTLRPLIVTNPIPMIDLDVNEDSTYYQTELILDAGYDPNWTYLWNGIWPYQTYIVTDRGYVRLVVTDTTTGCYGGDTVFVDLDILDYMITSIGIDVNACGGIYNDVPVYIINNGNMTRQGADISLAYYQDGVYLFTEEYSTTIPWQAGQSRTHTTLGAIDLQTTGSSLLEIEVTTLGDLRSENDNFTRNFNVMAHPVVDFGGSSLEVTFPYVLDAGAGHTGYQWSDGSDEQTYTATQTGTYGVTVTGTNGCETIVSVYLSSELGISISEKEDITMNIYPNPASDYVIIEVLFDNPDTYILELFNSHDMLIRRNEITGAAYREEWPVGDLPPGVYFIRIMNDEKYYIREIVIR